MIPLSLDLKGIYSYQGVQSIDFTKLTEENIFGIFGSVGSGKSTILEAISFALYGDTERLDRRDNRNYNMMNLKSNEFLIDFIFKTGAEDTEYRFIVKGKRNNKQFDKVGTYERSALKKIASNWEPFDANTVESIVGLSYENFRRTIIIPQNKFQEFLQLGDSDRTKMMKELFHLDKYELYTKVATLDQKNKFAKNTVDAKLNQIGEVTAEQIEIKENHFKLLGETIEKDDKAIKVKQKTELESRSLKEISDKVIAQTKKATDLELKEPSIKKLENNIHEFEKCQLNFKGIFENNKNISLKIKAKAEEIRLQTIKLNASTLSISKKENEFKAMKPRYDSRDQLKKKADEFDKIIKIIQLESDKKELTDKIKIGDDFIKTNLATHKKLTVQQKNDKTDLAKLKSSLPDLAELSEVRDWFTLRKGILKAIKNLETEAADISSEIKTASKNVNKIITPTIIKLLPDLSENPDNTEYIKNLKLVKSKIKKQIDALDINLQHLSAKNKLEEYAKNLAKGDPCPICGSKDHPHVLDLSDVSKSIRKLNQEKSSLNDSIELVDEVIQALTTSLKEIEGHTTNFEKTEKKLSIEKSNLEKHLKLFKWRKFSKEDEEAVNNKFKEADKLQKLVKAADEALDKLEDNIKKNSEIKEKADVKLKKIREDHSGKTSSIEVLNGQLKLLKFSDYKAAKLESLEKSISALNTEYKEIEKSFLLLEKEIKELKAEAQKLNGNLESGTMTLKEDEKTQKELDLEVKKQLKEHGYTSIELVETILKLNLNIVEERKKITQHRQELHLASETLKGLREQIGDKKYNEEEHSKLKKEIQILNESLDKLKGEKGSVENEIKSLKENLKSRENLKKEQVELALREEDINVLKQLFKGSGFVNFVSSVYLQNLCKVANDRFQKLTRQKLKLEITESNNFQVRDFLNDGQVRDVKTLSGGQTFQAALSLALALADNIQKLTKSSQNFFFLDEGFGALDKESLQIVFETLKALRKENRIVGVISHVEEMQQEIDTYLHITNEEGIGSVITTTWGKN